MKNIHISVVSPVYGCDECLTQLTTRLKSVLSEISEEYEIILVNDRSPDKSWEIICELAKSESRIKGINLSRNFGQYYAISAGLDVASGEWVVVMDCDLQDQPEEIVKLYKKALEGFDVVYGFDEFRGTKTFISQFFSKLYYKIFSFLADSRDNFNPSFILLNKKVVTEFRKYREYKRQFLTILLELGFTRIGVKVEHKEREIGKSSYTFVKKIKHAFLGITSSSTKLLRSGIFLGFVTSFVSMLYGMYIIFMKVFVLDYEPGWSSVITSIFFVGGVNMTLLGILGIYIEVIFFEVKNRPIYTVADKINCEEIS